MSERVRDMLIHGIAAAKGKSKSEARHYLEWVIDSPDADMDQLGEAWLALADVVDDPKEKRNCLEHALAHDPSNAEARREFAILDGRLNPKDIVDPDRMPARAEQRSPESAQARRFVCSQCGGKMAFTPDGTALTCAYCGKRQALANLTDNGVMLAEQDFTVALATAKGHSRPVIVKAIKCQGCGASFVLSPQALTSSCPYCASAYVVEQTETRELIEPEGIIPFAVTQDKAQQIVFEWYRTEGFRVLSSKALPAGVYLPVWTFDLTGEITWNCMVEEDNFLSSRRTRDWVPFSSNHLVCENDLTVAASHTLSASLTEELAAFPLDRLVPYDERYLADWPAETYQIAVGDASLVARWQSLERVRPRIEASVMQTYRDLQLNSSHLVVESYKLILVPLWIARYRCEDKWYTIIVNGQTGKVRGEKLRRGVSGWLSGLLGAS